MKIGTYNILHPEYAISQRRREGLSEEGFSNWQTRKVYIINNLKESNLDVIALQEVSKSSLDSLEVDQIGYQAFHSAYKSEGVAFLLKTNRYRFIAQKSQECLLRIDVEELVTKKVYRLVTGRLPKPIVNFAEDETEDTVIIAGDFNEKNMHFPGYHSETEGIYVKGIRENEELLPLPITVPHENASHKKLIASEIRKKKLHAPAEVKQQANLKAIDKPKPSFFNKIVSFLFGIIKSVMLFFRNLFRANRKMNTTDA